MPEETASCRTTSTQELQVLNEKFDIFRRIDLGIYSHIEEPTHKHETVQKSNSNVELSANSKNLEIFSQIEPNIPYKDAI